MSIQAIKSKLHNMWYIIKRHNCVAKRLRFSSLRPMNLTSERNPKRKPTKSVSRLESPEHIITTRRTVDEETLWALGLFLAQQTLNELCHVIVFISPALTRSNVTCNYNLIRSLRFWRGRCCVNDVDMMVLNERLGRARVRSSFAYHKKCTTQRHPKEPELWKREREESNSRGESAATRNSDPN